MIQPKQWSTEWGGRTLTFEVGKLALQATASLTVQYGDTKILATVVQSSSIRDGIDYFPLSVEFQEKLNAAGKIKGSRFIKREGRPSDESILVGRLIDRSIRPLFDQRIRNDIQVVLTPLSVDKENDAAVAGLVAASAVVAISPIPFDGPIGGARIGRINGEYILNATLEEIDEHSELDLFVAGTPDSLIMVEAAGDEIPEQDMYAAMQWGCKQLQPVIDIINQMARDLGVQKELPAATADIESKIEEIKSISKDFLYSVQDSMIFDRPRHGRSERVEMVKKLEDALRDHLTEKGFEAEAINTTLQKVKYMIGDVVTKRILDKDERLDGRTLTEIRSLYGEVDLIPRVHGSALFMRGDTQVLNTVALGAPGDVQTLDTMESDDETKRYMHHYSDAPFTYGETGFFRGPGRRAIGHGALAERALEPVLPDETEFPYAIRSVSEVLGSNGSSSMASTCASSMALMAAGVPLKKAVAGIAMGLASEADETGTITRWKVLTDLQDVEDGDGGMDFKIAGTADGITSMQMDTKTKGLTWDIVNQTVTQAYEARKEILAVMAQTIAEPRADLSPYAPRIITIQISPDKIGDIIGPGGKTINKIIDQTGVSIDIEQDGRVLITSTDASGTDKAVQMIKDLTREVEAGEVFEGKVVRLEDFGAFVELLPGKDGLVHVSEIAWERTNKPGDILSLGDIVKVKVKEIDNLGRINLSMKALVPKPEGYQERPPRDNSRGPRNGGGNPGGRHNGGNNRGPRKPHHDGDQRNSGGRASQSVQDSKPVHTSTTPESAPSEPKKEDKKKGLFGFGKK